ncbi:MAG: DUF1343 domain-containing protein [Bacteroidia bacterium]|nr:DUF1343 domain-containing protein [Bacteroidia bacterium]
MNTTKLRLIFLLLICPAFLNFSSCSSSGSSHHPSPNDSLPLTQVSNSEKPVQTRVLTGAENLLSDELQRLKGKRIAIAANHTTLLPDGTHLVDTLHSLGMDIKLIFAPEHGFRGDHDAGAKVNSTRDEKTGLPIQSLYGKNKKPTPETLQDIDVVIFDIQDVGARFYTYISTMTYLMEACAENNKQMMVLDRPNPNGWYVDGPVLKKYYSSFVGLHEIPVVHGMTVGEYAKMVNGEKWLAGGKGCILTVIPCKNYTHSMHWDETGLPWVAPSPNLKTEYAAYLYPMLCWFEGMPVSVGRGTDTPFEHIGMPWHVGYKNALLRDSIKGYDLPTEIDLYSLKMVVERFKPVPKPGAMQPKFEGKMCYGVRFTNRVDGQHLFLAGLSLLQNLQEERGAVKLTEPLFEPFFNKLTGTDQVAKSIEAGEDPETIYQSWQREVGLFKATRQKYLLYQ